jgi:hypothetical protein
MEEEVPAEFWRALREKGLIDPSAPLPDQDALDMARNNSNNPAPQSAPGISL